ncbi:hypothetical protein [Streptomyces sp. NPDC058268]|uniref:hypothetical protein n=1 Tax=Streptomyces sp. NPDC058268 TaxID=3346413 RepID=UPI0036EEFE65
MDSVAHETHDRVAVEYTHTAGTQHPRSNHPVHQRSRCRHDEQAAWKSFDPPSTCPGDHTIEDREPMSTRHHYLVQDAGKQRLDGEGTTVPRYMRMPALGHALPVSWSGGQPVTLDDGHLAVLLGEHMSSEHPGQPAAQNHRTARTQDAPGAQPRSGPVEPLVAVSGPSSWLCLVVSARTAG